MELVLDNAFIVFLHVSVVTCHQLSRCQKRLSIDASVPDFA